MAAGEQILIVESDPDIADLIGRQVLQPLGYQVAGVDDAASALKRAVQTPAGLMLANINLPGLSGKDPLPQVKTTNDDVHQRRLHDLSTVLSTVKALVSITDQRWL
ncbi:MAG: response regulator [Anaerolineales bacterium]|nr:response regulator [Anaerolineales bacterium]